ncbi:redox-sensing transcriptional repressor rex 2 [Clostridium sp. CAG:448]|nr:redox-sensing transcriptional repressor rex 2 [Clostridium sp. CAG:448]
MKNDETERMEVQQNSEEEAAGQSERPSISPAVIHRLPRYYRYLRELLTQGRTRISSGELAGMMRVTASQIRQDLNCFGGFGQQGYGYNVNYLYARISDLLGVGRGFHAVIIGAGDLGRALVHLSMFEKRGVDIIGMFDAGEGMTGREVAGVHIFDLSSLESFCAENTVDIAVLTLPKEQIPSVAARLVACGVKGLWNYMGVELNYSRDDIIIENVHLGDSLMILNYEISRKLDGGKQEEKEK